MNASTERFARLFRDRACRGIEYSVSNDPDSIGTMLRGNATLISLVREYVDGSCFGGDWLVAVSRLVEFVRPAVILWRLDWRRHDVTGMTLYARFPKPPSDALVGATMAMARPFNWTGPSPEAIGRVLGAEGPRGIALRASENGQRQVALYYHVAADVRDMETGVAGELLEVCGLPIDHCTQISQDLRQLYAPGEMGVIGVDCRPDGRVGALKFDPAHVVLRGAVRFLSSKHVSPHAVEILVNLANVVRVDTLSYLGVKYDERGFAGWRAYLSTDPLIVARPDMPRVMMEHDVSVVA